MGEHNVRFAEDIPKLAAEASVLAPRLCDTCRNYHFLWPYLRLAGAPGGAEDDKLFLKSVVADAMASGRQKILIAGAADTGLLALVAQAAVGHKSDIAVLDGCETPLELCRRFAARWSFPIEVLHVDLRDFSAQSSFDIVFAHMTLTFIPPDNRLDVVSRIRRSLQPNGRLILRFRTREHTDSGNLLQYRERVPRHLIERLEKMNIPLPESREAFRSRAEAYAQERHVREGTEGDYAETAQLVEAAGFAIEKMTAIESNPSAPVGDSTPNISKFLAILKPI
jgi:SAM-dependent methyltransferase